MSKSISTGYISTKINGIAVKANIKSHSGNYDNEAKRNVSYIVMHYTGNKDDTAMNNAKYFNTNDVNISAHFFVDETNIYQSVELRDEAWHCGTKGKYYHSKCRNENSFAIEMTTAGNYKISAKTIENSAYLCAYLCEILNIKASEVDTYVLRHYDVTHKKCPAQMVDNADEWEAFKATVKNILKSKEKKEVYRVRKSWEEEESQTGAFSVLDNAIAQAQEDKLNVYDSSGKEVYTYKVTTKAVTKGCKVKIKKGAKDYSGQKVASFVYNNVYKVDELNGKRAVLDKQGICTAFHTDNLIVQ